MARIVGATVVLWTLSGALASFAHAADPDPEPVTESSLATEAMQDSATMRAHVVRWRKQVQPEYPAAERSKGWPVQHCRCVFTLGMDGVPQRVEVTECAAPFQAAATDALLGWRTYPLDSSDDSGTVMALVQVDFDQPHTTNPTIAPSSARAAPVRETQSTRATTAHEDPDIRLARVQGEALAVQASIAGARADFRAQVIDADWYGPERVAIVRWLLDEASRTTTFQDGGSVVLLPTDRTDLARRLGTSTIVIDRVLRLIDSLGGASVHGDVVIVKDEDAVALLLGH